MEQYNTILLSINLDKKNHAIRFLPLVKLDFFKICQSDVYFSMDTITKILRNQILFNIVFFFGELNFFIIAWMCYSKESKIFYIAGMKRKTRKRPY